ncbi:efflux transporter outer membrane subunit [Pseudomonadota bacterium AL_CKDN230030165-1A_HGKHYDSX7]
MFARRFFLLSLSTSLLAGCAVGPDYQQPAVSLPAHFIGDGATHRADTLPPDALSSWWQDFNDPLLAQFVTKAIQQNLDLAQAMARVTQARAGLGSANAALLPHAAIDGSAGRAYRSAETPLGRVLSNTPDDDRWGNAYDTNIEASWEIDVFGGLRRSREAALADYQASEAAAAATRLAVAAQTADTYITIRGLQARIDIARRQAAVREALVSKVGLLVERGLAPEFQLRQAEGSLSQVQATIPALQTALDAAMNALDVMLGEPPGTFRGELAAIQAIPAPPHIAGMGSPAALLTRRPDLIAAEWRLVSTNARIGEAVAEYYPKFSLSGLLGSATTVSGGNLFTNGASQSAGVLGLRWRLFDFGRINAQIDLAKGRDAEALAAYRLAVLRATEDVENAFSALLHRGEQATTLTQGEAALSRARVSAQAAYERGTTSLIDVLYADASLLQASDGRAQAQTDAARSAVAAYKALGGGWDAPEAPKVSLR